MRLGWLTGMLLGCVCLVVRAQEAMPLNTEEAKLNYSFGFDLGQHMQEMPGLSLKKVFLRGVEDGLMDAEPLLSKEEQEKILKAHFTQRLEEQQRAWEQLARDNLKKESEFLTRYQIDHPDAKVLTNGLIYRVIEQGSGNKPTLQDTVRVEYTGRLPQGDVFDSSAQQGGPVDLPLSRVIAGWQAALPMMPEGSKWELVVPAKLAYGEAGAGGIIGPNQTLIFEIKLIEIINKR